MSATLRNQMREVMQTAWQFVRRNGYTMAEALRVAWANIKLRTAMKSRIVKFYFLKVDGSVREAYGTLKETLIPSHSDGQSSRRKNDTVQTFFDTEKSEWRCFKKANLMQVVSL